MNIDNGVGVKEASAFLTEYYKSDPTEAISAELIGEGAWSRCFGYQQNGVDLAIRFGNYVDDFENDRRACRYATPDLPIPQMLDIGLAYDGYYAIATRVHGVALESVGAAEWRELIPSIVAALEAIRTADLSGTVGIGGWGLDGNASQASWSEHLLAVAADTPSQRGGDWRATLAASSQGQSAFTWGAELLKQVVSNSVPRSLIHADLINRNVLVKNGRISGVFDWGCSRYGDHLYELAWFEFWSPWYPKLDMQLLRSSLEEQWRKIGYHPQDIDKRLLTCHLHIGLDHLRYNASIGDEVNLCATADRMAELANRT